MSKTSSIQGAQLKDREEGFCGSRAVLVQRWTTNHLVLYGKLFSTRMEGYICIATPSLDHAGNSPWTMQVPGT